LRMEFSAFDDEAKHGKDLARRVAQRRNQRLFLFGENCAEVDD
jgi:hypothetical protein